MLFIYLYFVYMLKSGVQEERGRPFHIEGAVEFQPGDDFERGRQRRREGCMGERVKDKDVGGHAEKLGGKLVNQHRSSKPETLF